MKSTSKGKFVGVLIVVVFVLILILVSCKPLELQTQTGKTIGEVQKTSQQCYSIKTVGEQYLTSDHLETITELLLTPNTGCNLPAKSCTVIQAIGAGSGTSISCVVLER